MNEGNGETPSNAEFLTRAIQAVIDEAVSEAVSTAFDLHATETRKIAGSVEEIRQSVGKQGLALICVQKKVDAIEGRMERIEQKLDRLLAASK